jgi:hypothetical protein
MKNNLRVIEINTTAFEEENFYLLTTLSDEQITKVITPIVEAERDSDSDGDSFYDNDFLVEKLNESYPNDIVTHYVHDGFDKITI